MKVRKDHIYKGAKKTKKTYRFAEVKGKNIYAGFCESNGYSYPTIDGKISADNSGCFDKWNLCPLCLEFPRGVRQQTTLLELLERLGSREGLMESRSFAYSENNPYHY